MEEKTSYSQNSYLKQPKSPKAQKPWSIHEIGIATRRQHCAVRTRLHPGMGSCAGNSVKWNGSPGWDTHPAIDHVQSVYTLTHTGSEVGWWGEDINHYIWMFLGCFIFLSSGLSLIFFFFFQAFPHGQVCVSLELKSRLMVLYFKSFLCDSFLACDRIL